MSDCSQLFPVIQQVLLANGIHQPNAPAALQAVAANETGCDVNKAPQVATNSFFSLMSPTALPGAHYIASNQTWTIPYNSPQEAVQGFINLMNTPRYSAVWNAFLQNGNAAQLYQGMCNQGYCGPVDYKTFPTQAASIYDSIVGKVGSSGTSLPVIGGVESGLGAVGGAISSVGNKIISAPSKAAQAAANAVESPIVDWLNSHSDAFKALGVGIVGLVLVFVGLNVLGNNLQDINIQTMGKAGKLATDA